MKDQGASARRQRFYREAHGYDSLNHRGLPRLIQSNAHHFLQKPYQLYLVTDFVEGKTLNRRVAKGTLGVTQAIDATLGLLDIVEHLHDSGWVHRDIKPDNIIFRCDSHDDPVLVDLGISVDLGRLQDEKTSIGQELGNRFLRLPELGAESPAKQDHAAI